MDDETLFEGGFIRVCQRGRWEYVERVNARGAVVIVAQTEAGHVVLVEQYRAPVDAPVIEFPAGLVGDIAGDEDEAFELAAARELEEETGFRASQFTYLTQGPPSPGLSNETTWWVRAIDAKRVGEGGGDDSEAISVHEVPLAGIDDWLQAQQNNGVVIDPKVFAGLYFLDRTTTGA